MKEIILKSGRVLKITPSPFVDAKALYQALLSEMKALDVGKDYSNVVSIMKDLLCAGFSSKEIENCLWTCMKRCIYEDKKINPTDTFEPIEAREDYAEICMEVALENVLPFTKNLYVVLNQILDRVTKGQAQA
jgi:hypothetical protein